MNLKHEMSTQAVKPQFATVHRKLYHKLVVTENYDKDDIQDSVINPAWTIWIEYNDEETNKNNQIVILVKKLGRNMSMEGVPDTLLIGSTQPTQNNQPYLVSLATIIYRRGEARCAGFKPRIFICISTTNRISYH